MRGSIYYDKIKKIYRPYIYLPKERNDGIVGKKVWGESSTRGRTAEANLRKLLKAYEDDTIITVKVETFEKITEEWKRLIVPEIYKSEQTRITNFGYLYNHVIPVIGKKAINKVTKQDIQNLFFRMRKKDSDEPLSDATRKKILSILNSVFESAKDWGQIKENPCDIKLKEPRIPKKIIWTMDELNLFLDYVNADNSFYYLPILILATTAIRRSEVCGLQWQDYHEDYLILDRGVDSKGKVTDMKTGSSHRRIVLMQVCKDSINMQISIQNEIIDLIKNQSGIKDKIKPWDYICTDDWNNQILPDALSKNFKRYLKRYNTEHENQLPDIPLKNLRHTFATSAINNGINIKIVSEILGHSRTSTTHNSYSQYQDTMQNDAIVKMENKIFSNSVHNSVHKKEKRSKQNA